MRGGSQHSCAGQPAPSLRPAPAACSGNGISGSCLLMLLPRGCGPALLPGQMVDQAVGAGNEDLAAQQGLDVGHWSLTVVGGDDHSLLARRRRPRRHGNVIGPIPAAAGPLGWRPGRSRCPCRRSGVIGSARTSARRWRLRSSRSAASSARNARPARLRSCAHFRPQRRARSRLADLVKPRVSVCAAD